MMQAYSKLRAHRLEVRAVQRLLEDLSPHSVHVVAHLTACLMVIRKQWIRIEDTLLVSTRTPFLTLTIRTTSYVSLEGLAGEATRVMRFPLQHRFRGGSERDGIGLITGRTRGGGD